MRAWAPVVLAALVAALPLAAVAETLVAARTLRAQTLIAPEDLAVIAEIHPGSLTDPVEAIGLEARVALYAGRPIRPGDVGPAAVVERNGFVVLIFRRGGLSIVTEGRALGRAAPGEVVRVMNLSSRVTVSGVVGNDGAVHVAGSSLLN